MSHDVIPVRLNTLTRCGYCGCPVEAGRHTDTQRLDCGHGAPLALCHSCRHDASAHSPSVGCTARHAFEPDACRCPIAADQIRGTAA